MGREGKKDGWVDLVFGVYRICVNRRREIGGKGIELITSKVICGLLGLGWKVERVSEIRINDVRKEEFKKLEM